MIKENKTKTEIIIAFSVLLFGAAIFFVIMEVLTGVLIYWKDKIPFNKSKPFLSKLYENVVNHSSLRVCWMTLK